MFLVVQYSTKLDFLYYIFKDTLLLFLVIFETDKNDNFLISLEEINPEERSNAPSRAKIRTNDLASKYQLRHFRTSKRLKRTNLEMSYNINPSTFCKKYRTCFHRVKQILLTNSCMRT